jgi:hypothetical protein
MSLGWTHRAGGSMLSASISKTAHTTPSKSGLVTTLIGHIPIFVEDPIAVIFRKKQTDFPVAQPIEDKAIHVSTIQLNRNSQ